MKRIVLGIEYDGAGFQGYQTQPHGETVQDALERALSKFTSGQFIQFAQGELMPESMRA